MCCRILQDAPVAQIRGGFINWNGLFAKVIVVIEKLQDAPIAQIKG
jgi:hypothetical protein